MLSWPIAHGMSGKSSFAGQPLYSHRVKPKKFSCRDRIDKRFQYIYVYGS